jgi:hypothetical protein
MMVKKRHAAIPELGKFGVVDGELVRGKGDGQKHEVAGSKDSIGYGSKDQKVLKRWHTLRVIWVADLIYGVYGLWCALL